MSNLKPFLQHIAGLRGIAVLLVVLGHLSIPGFSSGFIGVDVFFVISGFLITGILVREYQANRDPESRIGTISLKAFYLRRARRILPASILVTLVVVVFSWTFNNAARFGTILNDSIWATLFGANINYALKATDYFQIGAAPSPFQHFWSLAVEEQFYFIWPTLILSALALRAFRFRGKLVSWENRLTFLFAGVTVISFIFMVLSFLLNPSLSYFLTASRAWELSLGALGAMLVRQEDGILQRFYASVIGKVLPGILLLASMFLITDRNFGYTLPLVVIASFLLVTKNSESKDVDVKALSNRVLGFVGNISYSLYLWHWPIIVFAEEFGFGKDLIQKAIIFLASVGISTLSYYFVELKFQKIELPKFFVDNSMPLSKPFWIAAASTLTILFMIAPSIAVQPQVQTAFASVFQPKKVDEPFPTSEPTATPTNSDETAAGDWFTRRQAEIKSSNEAIADRGKLTDKQISEINRVASGDTYAKGFGFSCSWGDCTLGDPSAKIKILLLGDSHALMYQSTFSAIKQSGVDIYVSSKIAGECNNVMELRSVRMDLPNSQRLRCDQFHKDIVQSISELASSFDFVVLSDGFDYSSHPKYYVEDATSFVNAVKQAGKRTVVLGQIPNSRDLVTCINKEYSNYSECSGSRVTSIHDYMVAKNAQVAFGDPGSLYCLDNYCPLIIGDSPVNSRGHLTDAAGFQIAPYFLDFLKAAKVPNQ